MLGLFVFCFRIWTLCQNHFHLFPQLFIHILLCHSNSSSFFFFFGTCLLSACEIFLSNIARCVVTHCDAHTVCIFAVWDYHNAPNTSSRLFLQTAVCMYVCCVVVMGVWYCTVEGYNLVVNKSWKNQWPVEFRARCSPTASKPTSCS